MTPEKTVKPSPWALVPTTAPLPPQEIRPDELKAMLAEAAQNHAETAAALAAAQDHFDAAERQREYALSEEQKRREREEQARIDKLRSSSPAVDDDAARSERLFYEACTAEDVDAVNVLDLFAKWARQRSLSWRIKQEVIRYDSAQSRDGFVQWERRAWGWNELLRSVTSAARGGALNSSGDDLKGLEAVNERINDESKDAPRPLHREASDQSTVYTEDLGLRDPAMANLYNIGAGFISLEFDNEFSRAIDQASSGWARRTMDAMSAEARSEFAATKAEAS